jgi:putative aldouronate transport system substrate-binding protein
VLYAKGDFVDLENYRKDSYVVKYEMPVATEEEIFSSVFVISSYSVENPTTNPRAMDFLYYLNTDVTMKTLLQYGVEGVHYELVYAEDDINLENPSIKIISDDYSMNTLYTGNIYKTYRAEGVTLADSWETAKEQNLDSVIK